MFLRNGLGKWKYRIRTGNLQLESGRLSALILFPGDCNGNAQQTHLIKISGHAAAGFPPL